MHRTQIQLPDALYAAATDLARRKEISFTELVRRGLEYLLETSPGTTPAKEWTLPEAHNLGGYDIFSSDNWRESIYSGRLKAAESKSTYRVKKKK